MRFITLMIIFFTLPGCSVLNQFKLSESESESESVFNVVPKCELILNNQTTYWSKFEGNAIYLFVGSSKTKCLLREM